MTEKSSAFAWAGGFIRQQPPLAGGETPPADSRRALERLGPEVRGKLGALAHPTPAQDRSTQDDPGRRPGLRTAPGVGHRADPPNSDPWNHAS